MRTTENLQALIDRGYDLIEEGDYQDTGDWFYNVGAEILELAQEALDQRKRGSLENRPTGDVKN